MAKDCPALESISCEDNKLQVLVADNCPLLGQVKAYSNQLMWLDMKDAKASQNMESTKLAVDDQQPVVQAVKISPTEVGLRIHERMDVSRVLNLKARGLTMTPKEIFVDDIRYFVIYDNGPDVASLIGSKGNGYDYDVKWPNTWQEGNSKDNLLPVTLNVNSWTKHQAWIKLTDATVVTGLYGKPTPEPPTVIRSQDYDGKLTWTSSNTDVVTVNAETGALTVVGVGTAVITVSGAETDYRLAPKSVSYTVVINYQPADVNGDGEVGIGDIVSITNVMADITTDASVISRADVNNDAMVGIGDIVSITNAMAGK